MQSCFSCLKVNVHILILRLRLIQINILMIINLKLIFYVDDDINGI
jgi:hypothetical protein